MCTENSIEISTEKLKSVYLEFKIKNTRLFDSTSGTYPYEYSRRAGKRLGYKRSSKMLV